MDDGVRKCEMVKAQTPKLAIEKLISIRGPMIEILSHPRYHALCNLRYSLWKYYDDLEKGIRSRPDYSSPRYF